MHGCSICEAQLAYEHYGTSTFHLLKVQLPLQNVESSQTWSETHGTDEHPNLWKMHLADLIYHCLGSSVSLTSIMSLPWINTSLYIIVCCQQKLTQSLVNLRSFAHLLDRSFGRLCGWSSAHDFSPNLNLLVVVVIINYESVSLSTASLLCIEELEWMHFIRWSSQERIKQNVIWMNGHQHKLVLWPGSCANSTKLFSYSPCSGYGKCFSTKETKGCSQFPNSEIED